MRIVFLDLDGVLATEGTYSAHRKAAWAALNPGVPYPRRKDRKWPVDTRVPIDVTAQLLDPVCCAAVQTLCVAADAQVVVSSTWRTLYPLDTLRTMFQFRGLSAPVVGVTDEDGVHRGAQIHRYMGAQGLGAEDIVILDDEEDVAPHNGRRIQTAFNGSRAGFRERHLRRALALWGL